MAYNNKLTLLLVLAYLMLCCFCTLSCADGLRADLVRARHHVGGTSAIARLKRMESSIKALQSGKNESPAGGVVPVNALHRAYTMIIGIGTPPVYIEAQLDTASDLIWFQCSPCTNCWDNNGLTGIFQPTKSSSYTNVPCPSSLCSGLPNSTCTPHCNYSHNYMNSWKTLGELSYETFTMTNTSGAPLSFPGITFGCSHDTQGDGVPRANGVVGLGRGELSLISQIGESKFSYCLLLDLDDSSYDLSATPLFFGSAAELNGTGVQSTFIIKNPILPQLNSYYYLSVEGISVGNMSLNIPRGTLDIQADGSGGFIIDSAMPYTVLPNSAFGAIASVLDSGTGLRRTNSSVDGFSLCYKTAYPVFPNLSITFHFGGSADYVITGTSAFRGYRDNDSYVVCLAMLDMGNVSLAGAPAVLGNFQQQDFHILYDNGNEKLSFVPTNCNSLNTPILPWYGKPPNSKASTLRGHYFLLLLIYFLVSLLDL